MRQKYLKKLQEYQKTKKIECCSAYEMFKTVLNDIEECTEICRKAYYIQDNTLNNIVNFRDENLNQCTMYFDKKKKKYVIESLWEYTHRDSIILSETTFILMGIPPTILPIRYNIKYYHWLIIIGHDITIFLFIKTI